jgi:hypothetical protein
MCEIDLSLRSGRQRNPVLKLLLERRASLCTGAVATGTGSAAQSFSLRDRPDPSRDTLSLSTCDCVKHNSEVTITTEQKSEAS